MKALLNAFNAGEVSPALEGRVDLPNIAKACRKLRNFLPSVTGGAYRRPPMTHVKEAMEPGAHVRLIPFNFSATTKFIIEAGEKYLRFWDGAGAVEAGDFIESPWSAADLEHLQFAQTNDVMFFARDGYPPYELLRLPEDKWELREIPWKYPPLRDENVEATTLRVDGLKGLPGTPGPGDAGTAVKELWAVPKDRIKLYLPDPKKPGIDAVTWMANNAPTSTTANSGPPTGTGHTYPGSIQRVRGYWIAPASGTVRFLIENCRSFGRVIFNATAGAGATGAVILKLTATGGGNQRTAQVAGIVAGKAYWVEFVLVATNPPGQGVFKYAFITEKVWSNILPSHLAAERTPGDEVTRGLKLIASDALFEPGHVGSYWQIGHYRDTLSTELSFTEAETATVLTKRSEGIRVKGRWEFFTYGRWEGSVFVEQRNKAGQWDIIRRFTGKMDTNKTAAGVVEGEEVMRVRAVMTKVEPSGGTDRDPDLSHARFVLEAIESRVHGLVRATEYIRDRELKVDMISPVWSGEPTALWSEGAWSKARGYPRTVTLHRQRLIFAGTVKEPQSLWGSVSGDFRNFERTLLEDGSFYYQIASQESNPIFWLASQDGLIIGTQGDEWIMEGDVSGTAPAAVKRQSRYGSEQVAPLMAGSVVLFVQRGGTSLREYVFVFDQQNYTAPHLSQLVEHMTAKGIRYIAYAQNPDQVVWVVTRDGRLLSCTYRREEEVVAWAEHPTDGAVESVAVVYGSAAAADEVWLTVRRGGKEGGEERAPTARLERLDPLHWRRLRGDDPQLAGAWHLDASVRRILPQPGTEVGDLWHLEGKQASVLTGGAEHPPRTVIKGKIALEEPATEVTVGLPYTSTLQPMGLDFPFNDGTAQGRRFRLTGLSARLYRSAGLWWADSPESKFYEMTLRTAGQEGNAPPPLFTGLKRLKTCASHRDAMEMVVRTESALPLNILYLVPDIEVYGS